MFAFLFFVVAFRSSLECQYADSVRRVPTDVVDYISRYCDDAVLCRLSEADKANQAITKEARMGRKKQRESELLTEMYIAVSKLQRLHVTLSLPHLQCNSLRNTSTILAVTQFHHGFDHIIDIFRNSWRSGQPHPVREQAQWVHILLNRYRVTFRDRSVPPFHRLIEVRRNISMMNMCLFDEYVELYMMARKIESDSLQMAGNEFQIRFAAEQLVGIMEEIGARIGYPILNVRFQSNRICGAQLFAELVNHTMPVIEVIVNTTSFVTRLKAFAAFILSGDAGCRQLTAWKS